MSCEEVPFPNSVASEDTLYPFPNCKILVIGNICAGKTTLALDLHHHLGFPLAILDDFRKQYSDGTIAGDYFACAYLLRACSGPGPAILEFSGAGPHAWAVRMALGESDLPCIVILVDTPIDTCIARATIKVFDVPFPDEWSVPVEQTIQSLSWQLAEDHVAVFWELGGNCHVLIHRNDQPIDQLIAEMRLVFTRGNLVKT